MSASLIGWIWNVSKEKSLSTGARLTLFALSEHTNFDNHGDWRVYPSQDRLAKMVNCSRFTLRKYLKELVDAGLLAVKNQYADDGRQMQNLYWLMAPKFPFVDTDSGKKRARGVANNESQGWKETCHKSLNKEPLNNNKTKESNLVTVRWTEFWTKYPRKDNKKNAEKAFRKLSAKDQKAAISGIDTFAFSEEKKYIAMATTWLNGRRWEDGSDTKVDSVELELC